MKRVELVRITCVAFMLAGCSAHARTPEEYRDGTASLLDTKSGEIKSCYDQVLAETKDAKGTVKVKFTVQHESGKIKDAKIDASGTTAPEAVQTCVLRAIDGIALAPGDGRDGLATFTWEFAPSS